MDITKDDANNSNLPSFPIAAQQRKMFAFNDSAAAAITTGGGEAASEMAEEAEAAAVMAATVSHNLTRTALLEDGVQQLVEDCRYKVRAFGMGWGW